jgi:hypothetical protein
LLLSPHKPFQGLYDGQVWAGEHAPSRRAMPAGVFAAGWATEALMPRHRAVMAPAQRGRGREVRSLDWTYAPHGRGPPIGGLNKAWDHGEKRLARYQTVVTAVSAQHGCLDGVEVVVQQPSVCEEERAYVRETTPERDAQRARAQGRLVDLLHPLAHRRASQQRTERALAIAQHLAEAGPCPPAPYAFDHGLCTLALPRFLERVGKHGGSEVEGARPLPGEGQWQRVDTVAAALRPAPPERVRPVTGRCRNGERKPDGVFTKVVRLKRDGRKRLVMVHDPATLSETPQFWLTDAHQGASGRVLETWR